MNCQCCAALPADAFNVRVEKILNAKCVSGQCSTTLIHCIISYVLPGDHPFRVETCRTD